MQGISIDPFIDDMTMDLGIYRRVFGLKEIHELRLRDHLVTVRVERIPLLPSGVVFRGEYLVFVFIGFVKILASKIRFIDLRVVFEFLAAHCVDYGAAEDENKDEASHVFGLQLVRYFRGYYLCNRLEERLNQKIYIYRC